jgi:hypothetical protein
MTPEGFVWFVSGVINSEKDRAKQINPGCNSSDIEFVGAIKTIADALTLVESPLKSKLEL